MRILIGCNKSVREALAFTALGHDAWTCDTEPAEYEGNHIQDDILNHLDDGWDMAIFNPPCDYLANSGVRWLHFDGKILLSRMEKVWKASDFFNALLNAPIPLICIENPIQHKYARQFIRKYDQIIQPHYFGDKESKATCLWLVNLPKLFRTHWIPKEEIKQSVWRELPGENRKANRSRTPHGLANEMANQWGYPRGKGVKRCTY